GHRCRHLSLKLPRPSSTNRLLIQLYELHDKFPSRRKLYVSITPDRLFTDPAKLPLTWASTCRQCGRPWPQTASPKVLGSLGPVGERLLKPPLFPIQECARAILLASPRFPGIRLSRRIGFVELGATITSIIRENFSFYTKSHQKHGPP